MEWRALRHEGRGEFATPFAFAQRDSYPVREITRNHTLAACGFSRVRETSPILARTR
jgi:hypothetical protein